MECIDYLKLQAKNLYRDFKTRYKDEYGYDYNPKYFNDIYDILYDYNVDTENFSLMKAQHLIAQMIGSKSWSKLINSSKEMQTIAKSLFEHRDDTFNGQPFIQSWIDYSSNENIKILDDESKLNIFKSIFLNDETALK